MPKIGEKTVSVTVAVRIRPLSTSHESSVVQAFEEEVLRSNVTMRTHENLSNTLIITDPDNPQRNHTFTFDHLYNSMTRASTFEGGADQETIFRELSAPLLEHSLEGYNTCLFAYGQTGSGKTYTITGFENPEVPVARESERHGILPRLANALFEAIRTHSSETRTLQVRMSYYEIYNEKVRCLLNPDPNVTYRVREHPILGPFVVDLTSVELQDENDMLRSIRRATRYRHTAATQMNATSSRSHAVCSLNITSTVFDANSGEVSETVSVANLVDLAGSERTDAAGTSGIRLIEGTNINKSLLTLGHVIEALAASSSDTPLSPRGGGSSGAPRKFVPYRESLLTWLLKESLGGNSRTVMLATVSPHARNYDESLNTLRYADRAKYIRSVVVINVDTGKQLITDLKAEISILREQLERYTSHWAMANRWGAANGPNSIMLPHAQMPYLIQTYPLPSLNEIFLYYLNKDDVVITRSQSALVTGSADAQSSKISVESLIGHQDYQKVSLRSGLNVLLDHVVLKFERSEHHRGQMYVTHLRGPVRINNTIVHPSHTPRYIPPQANLEVGMYQFKVYNPQETDPYMGEEEEVKQSIPKTISRDQPSSSSALNKRTTRGHPTMDKPNSVSHANSVSNDAVVIQKALEKYLSPNIDVSSLECRKVLCNRRGVEGECVLAKDGGSVRLFTWNEETEQWKPTENVPPQRTRELAASLVEVQDASRAVQSILGAAKFSEILKKLPRENELALEGPVPESDTVRLVRAEQFRDKIIAMRWNAGEKIWVRATVADAERCTMRLMEKERAKEFDQTVKALLAKRGAETLQASHSTKPGASSASNQVPAVSRETQEVQEEEEEESELDQAKIEELNAAFAERAKALDSEREKIEAQISVVKSQLDTITAENQECERQHREKKEQILKQQVIQRAELEAEAASLHNANQQLRSTVEEKAAYINVLLNQMKQVEETRDVSIHSIQGLRKNIACLEKEKEKTQIEIQSIQENILQLRAENERMKADRTNVQHQLSVEVPETEEEIQAKIILLGAECQERTEQHEQTYRNLVTLQKQCETIYDRIKANEETLSKVHSEKEYLNELIQSEEAELNAIINETHQSLQQKKEGLEKNLVEARRMQLQHSDEISIMVEQARKDERRMLLAQMTSLEQENAKLLGEARQGFHMSIRSLQRERNREKEVVQGIMAKRESMKKRLKDLETTLDNKERQVKALVDEHVGWLSKLQVCKSNVEKGQNVTEKITNVEVKLRQTLQRAQDLERLAKDNKKEEDELRSEARALKDQHGHLRQDLDALVNKMRTLEKEIKTARMDALDMKREASFLVRGEETRDIRHLSSRNLTELIASSPRNVATPSYMRQTVASQARQPTDSGADASDVMMATSGSFSQPPTVNTMQQPGLRKIFSSSTLRPGSPVSSPHGMKSPTSGHSTTPRRRGNGTHSPRR